MKTINFPRLASRAVAVALALAALAIACVPQLVHATPAAAPVLHAAGIPNPISGAASWAGWHILNLAQPILVAALTVPTMQLFKLLFAAVDHAPTWLKQACVMTIAAVFTTASSVVGVQFPLSGDQVTSQTVSAILAAVLAMLYKHAQQVKAQMS